MRSLAIPMMLVTLAPALASAPTAAAAPPRYVEQAVADPTRPEDDRKLDADRKPAELLVFAGVKPGQSIAEFLPGGGYYTRMLSDIVGPTGKIFALETTTWGPKNVDATKQALAELHRPNITLDLAPLGTFNLPEKVDVFWTSLNYHDLHIERYAKVDMAAFNKHVFDSLRPGGVYFIVDHEAAAGTDDSTTSKIHRIEKGTVVREVTSAGFRLIGESPLLRNPADDHSKTVFDPPLRFKTDQFILKFRRP